MAFSSNSKTNELVPLSEKEKEHQGSDEKHYLSLQKENSQPSEEKVEESKSVERAEESNHSENNPQTYTETKQVVLQTLELKGHVDAQTPPAERLFHPIFTNRDEIVLLKGAYKFNKMNEKNDIEEWPKFHNFIKNDLGGVFGKNQVYEKMRRLRKKYLKKKCNSSTVFKKGSHEAKLFKYSERLWEKDLETKKVNRWKRGKDIMEEDTQNKKSKIEVDDKLEVSFPDILTRTATLIESGILRKLQQQWRSIVQEEMELNLKKTNFLIEVQRMTSQP